jgi:hypothetical protein
MKFKLGVLDGIKNEGRRPTRGICQWLPALCAIGLALVTMAGPGCKSHSVSQYVSPRVEGRVVDARTREPIEGVKIRRIGAFDNPHPMEPPKGGQILQQKPAVVTDKDGRFVLESERTLSVFRTVGWFAVDLMLEHYLYVTATTNFTLMDSTNTPKGEPLVEAGDIPLVAREK